MENQNIVVVGASAGGLEPLQDLVSQLPPNFPAAVFVAWHMPPEAPSLLPQILQRLTDLPVSHPVNHEKIESGHIYCAAPDYHLVIENNHARLSRGPRENHFRPSIDVLFRSAAWSFGARATGIILSGCLDDGVSGLFAIKRLGGKAIVQDPAEASFPDMPLNALKAVEIDYSVSVKAMGNLLIEFAAEKSPENGHRREPSKYMETEIKIALEENALEIGSLNLGEKTSYTCPECHGALVQIAEGRTVRFRCHTGHAFSLNSLMIEVTKGIETSLWNSLRVIEESQILMSHVARHLSENGNEEAAELLLRKVEFARKQASGLRELTFNNQILSADKVLADAAGN
ncbi:MAG TPA: chemotaxis protein CheB [Pyrinomonadaceae bacterium]|jgi:two-component system chemotaxis response regulator CheB